MLILKKQALADNLYENQDSDWFVLSVGPKDPECISSRDFYFLYLNVDIRTIRLLLDLFL